MPAGCWISVPCFTFISCGTYVGCRVICSVNGINKLKSSNKSSRAQALAAIQGGIYEREKIRTDCQVDSYSNKLCS